MYEVRCYYRDKPGKSRLVYDRLTLEEAQAICRDPETSSKTATSASAKAKTRRNGPWFYGYTKS